MQLILLLDVITGWDSISRKFPQLNIQQSKTNVSQYIVLHGFCVANPDYVKWFPRQSVCSFEPCKMRCICRHMLGLAPILIILDSNSVNSY